MRVPLRPLALAFLLVSGGPAGAQTGGEEPIPVPSLPRQLFLQWSIEDVRPKPEPKEHVGTHDDTVERLSLREAVATALENNPGIAAERLGPQFARASIDRALGVFDPLFVGNAEINRSITPSSSALAGADTVRERRILFGAELRKLVRTGARVSAAFNSDELRSNSDFLGLRPQYRPTVLFSLTQPLLRDFGPDLTILLVRSAEAQSSLAYYRYQERAAALVRSVVEGYWGVVGAQENLKAEEDGRRFAETLVRENGARVRAGTLPPIAVREAEAEAAAREERVILAENALRVARERLRLLLQRNPQGAFVPRAIDPADSPEVRDVEPDEQAVLENAIAGRPELLQSRYEVQNQAILAKIKRNNLLPQLDVRGSYGLNGLSGRTVPQTDFRTGETVETRFGGDYGRGLDRLSSGEFTSYAAGVTLSFPLDNAVAEAEYTQSRIDLRRSELGYKQLLSDVTLQVRQTVGDVRANSKRITATRLARELAQENLAQQHKRYDVGLATTKDILDFQEKLTTARAAETRALIDYNVSLAALRQSEGSLLAQFDIVLEQLPPTSTPLWARF
jgi:outer membrane protein TolC